MQNETPPAAAASAGAPTILVVDDNELNRDMLSRRLARRGYATAVAADGYRALDWLDRNRCDLVLLDIMMPGLSGMDVLARIRATRDGTELPVIMATARDQQADIINALKLGANDYVTKPLEFPVVLARVSVQVELKAANDRVRRLAQELAQRNEFIRSVFGRYLTVDIAATLLDTPHGLALRGERREITILMADLRGFTAIAAERDPGDVVIMVNHFLAAMTEVILRHGGTIDEFIGDAVLVLFGAPRPLHDHAPRAVACAIEMQQAMAQVNDLNRARGLPAVSTGIGINTGEVIVGNIGSEHRAKYGVVGHNVNLTSRIESFTAGGQILISEQTRRLCGEELQTRGELSVRPKGYDHDVRLYDVSAP
jgi:adenylate cyclase